MWFASVVLLALLLTFTYYICCIGGNPYLNPQITNSLQNDNENETVQNYLLKTMNYKENKPCKKFYEYSCKNYRQNFKKNPMILMEEQIYNFLKKELNTINDDDVSKL